MIDGRSIRRLHTTKERIIRRPPTNVSGTLIQIAHDELHESLRHFREAVTLFFRKLPMQFTGARPYYAQLFRGVSSLRGQVFYFGGHHRKSPASITGSRRFYSGVERKNIDFTCDSFTHEHVIIDTRFNVTNDVVDVQIAHSCTLTMDIFSREIVTAHQEQPLPS